MFWLAGGRVLVVTIQRFNAVGLSFLAGYEERVPKDDLRLNLLISVRQPESLKVFDNQTISESCASPKLRPCAK
jgi:hypothetical protein